MRSATHRAPTGLLVRGVLVALSLSGAGCGGSARERTSNAPPYSGPIRPAEGPLVIHLTAEDYTWTARYPGADQIPGTADDRVAGQHVHVPADTPVRLVLHSRDYLYTLALPHLELSEIAVPELEFALEFESGTAGRYEMPGDQFCGYTHPDLLGTLVVEDDEAHRAWLADRSLATAEAEGTQ